MTRPYPVDEMLEKLRNLDDTGIITNIIVGYIEELEEYKFMYEQLEK